MIIEGTNIGQKSKSAKSEQIVRECFKEIMSKRKNVFILCSSQDADRLESIYRAHWSGKWRPLVCDKYQKDIMMAIADSSKGEGPYYQFKADNIIDYWPTKQGLINKMKECGFTMLIRKSQKYKDWLNGILPFCKPEETSFVYSMYRGYVEKGWNGFSQESFDFIQPLVENSVPCLKDSIHYDYNHTSGHASEQSLQEICELINPKIAIIPIHKDEKSDIKTILPKEFKQKVCEYNYQKDDITITFDPSQEYHASCWSDAMGASSKGYTLYGEKK